MEARICMQLLCMKLCFISQKQSQIDDFQDVTGQILKVINLALFLDDFQDVAGDILPYLSHRRRASYMHALLAAPPMALAPHGAGNRTHY